jgi:oxygen-independent coproporphyrinogen-3 oxidase
MAGQTEEELRYDAEAAIRLGTTTIDFYPINNLTAPRQMHRRIREAGLEYLPATIRVKYRILLDSLLRERGYAAINGYSYSLRTPGERQGVVQRNPNFLYHDLVYGYEDDEIIGYGSSAISQMIGYNLHNCSDRRKYVSDVLHEGVLCHEAFGRILAPERGIVSFPFRGDLEKNRIRWERVPGETWIAMQEAVASGLIIDRGERYELSPAGWLFYVNLMYYLMPNLGKEWITDWMKRQCAAGRSCGETSLGELLNREMA